jgi:hypothetical protein
MCVMHTWVAGAQYKKFWLNHTHLFYTIQAADGVSYMLAKLRYAASGHHANAIAVVLCKEDGTEPFAQLVYNSQLCEYALYNAQSRELHTVRDELVYNSQLCEYATPSRSIWRRKHASSLERCQCRNVYGGTTERRRFACVTGRCRTRLTPATASSDTAHQA